jgi:hypothetical protein
MGEAARRRAALFSAEATARGVAAVYDEELRRRNLLR